MDIAYIFSPQHPGPVCGDGCRHLGDIYTDVPRIGDCISDGGVWVKTVAWRRVLPIVGDVWVHLNPINGRYRWRCPGRSEFKEWSFSHFRTADDAFAAAEKVIARAPSLIEH